MKLGAKNLIGLKLKSEGGHLTETVSRPKCAIGQVLNKAAGEKGTALRCREQGRTLEYFNGANPSIGIQMSAPRQTQAVKRIEGVI
jgi:hypothetical protein